MGGVVLPEGILEAGMSATAAWETTGHADAVRGWPGLKRETSYC